MAKKKQLTQDDMERIEALIAQNEQQTITLSRILLSIEGDKDMGVEGIVGAQRRIENNQKEIVEKIDTRLKEVEDSIDKKIDSIKGDIKVINEWRNIISIYLGVATSKKLWRGLMIFMCIVIIIILSIKYGFLTVWHYIKSLFL